MSESRRDTRSSDFNDYYTLGKLIGHGTTANIYECNTKSGEILAVKVFAPERSALAAQEAAILELLAKRPHTSILGLLQCYITSASSYHLVFERADEDLEDKLQVYKILPEQSVSPIVRQLASALAHLHSHGIAHRDIKMKNVLCFNLNEFQFNVKLGDFGAAIQSDAIEFPAGTRTYMAPEICLIQINIDQHNPPPYTKLCDIWSLGVLAFRLLFQIHPFRSTCPAYEALKTHLCENCIMKMRAGLNDSIFNASPINGISAEAKNFLQKLLKWNATERLTAEQILAEQWIMDYQGQTPMVIYSSHFNKFI